MHNKPNKILIVENDPVILAKLNKMLIDLHYSVCCIVSTDENVSSLVKDKNPDMILMNINLNGNPSGIDIAKDLCTFTDIPIIYILSGIDNNSITGR